MHITNTKCTKYVDEKKACIYCQGKCVKNGTAYGKQRFLCCICKRSFVSYYTNVAYGEDIDNEIKAHLKEGCGIRSIARLLEISVTTVLKRIMLIAKSIIRPVIFFGKEYELDEMRTYIKSKKRKCWIVYAIRKDTKEVVDFTVGSRTNKTLQRVTETLILSQASKVYTDKLPSYKSLLPEAIHNTKFRDTNHIERKNLSLRTHLKRLNRKTICFSKNKVMLSACLRIYFWS